MAEYAEDVTDLREAQRIIAHLRKRVAELIEESQPIEGEFTAFLTDKDTDRLETLFRLGKLVYDQDDDLDLDEVFTVFVEEALDLKWDIEQMEEAMNRASITPSA